VATVVEVLPVTLLMMVLVNLPASMPLPLKLPVGELLLSLALKYPEGLTFDAITTDCVLEKGGLELTLELVLVNGAAEVEVPKIPDILPSLIAASVKPR